ncbi:MAG: RtcB family protein, partial [Acidobacteriota bacterium]
RRFAEKVTQLGSYGGGNHFGECEVVRLADGEQETAQVFGLRDGHVAFLSHCGSRGFGHNLAMGQFKALQGMFATWDIPLPGRDRELVYAPLGTPEADAYLDDMALGANFATVNHLLINALVLEAFQEVMPGITGNLVYFISHNIARREIVDSKPMWVHRKGATRAFPAGHFALRETPFAATGHPILLPGDPQSGSAVMVAEAGAERSCFSVNHGAGRRLGRKQAFRTLDQAAVDRSFDERDILSNCRAYPRDEAPDAYKDFDEVLASVKQAGLAREVARLEARFVIKDASKADD